MHDWYAATTTHRMGVLHTPVRDEGAGTAVVCLHGFPTSSWDFEPVWPALTARHRAVAFDLLGLGRAAKPAGPLPVSLQADLAEHVLVERGVTEAHILAHDLGDTVAQELLARGMDGTARVRWRSVVWLNGGLFPETHRPRLVQRLLMSPVGGLVARLSGAWAFRRNMRRIFGPKTPPSDAFLEHGWALLTADDGRQALPSLIRYMQERRDQRTRWVRPLAERVVPMRLINGSLDPVSGRHMAERYAELVPSADVVHLDQLGHYPHVECPDVVSESVLSFFSAVDAGAA